MFFLPKRPMILCRIDRDIRWSHIYCFGFLVSKDCWKTLFWYHVSICVQIDVFWLIVIKIVSLMSCFKVVSLEGNICDYWEPPLSDGIRFLWPTRIRLWTQRKVQHCFFSYDWIEWDGMMKLNNIMKHVHGANYCNTKIYLYYIICCI